MRDETIKMLRDIRASPSDEAAVEIWKTYKKSLVDRFCCIDCDTINTEDYMVHDAVWADAGLKPNAGVMCLSCLQRRLERSLVMADFTPYSRSVRWGHDMARRELEWCTSPDDAQKLTNHLSDLRGDATIQLMEAKQSTNADARAIIEGAANSKKTVAAALHRLLARAGIRGIGPPPAE